jgi:hypothetical protein
VLAVGCSTTTRQQTAPAEGGPLGPSESACEVLGYIDETDGGQCPAGTCLVLAFDTNGARLSCCTSIASGPGVCADGGTLGSMDATVSDAEPEATSEADSGGGGSDDAAGGGDAAVDGGTEAETAADSSADAHE